MLPELADLGSQAELTGSLTEECIRKGSLELRLPQGIAYRLQLTNTGSGVVLSGSAHAQAVTECSRCLEEARIDLDADVECYYVLRPRDSELATADDEVVLVGVDGCVDLREPIIAALVFETPVAILCRSDCAGLCPHCGADLNDGACGCANEVDPSHPLAALRQLIQ
ncbi:MAG: YceD family protein [Actinomycetia bacterium]|nr:YceD family protein [Actinomycetes bacterium]